MQRSFVGAVPCILGKTSMPATWSGPSKGKSGGKYGRDHIRRSPEAQSLDFTLGKMENNEKF